MPSRANRVGVPSQNCGLACRHWNKALTLCLTVLPRLRGTVAQSLGLLVLRETTFRSNFGQSSALWLRNVTAIIDSCHFEV